MSNKVLTQDEIDDLLCAISDGMSKEEMDFESGLLILRNQLKGLEERSFDLVNSIHEGDSMEVLTELIANHFAKTRNSVQKAKLIIGILENRYKEAR